MNQLGPSPASVLLELTVHNHPSVLARLANLCSRRAYVIEGMLCAPVRDAPERSVWLLVQVRCSMEQVERQLLKLEDVRRVQLHSGEHPWPSPPQGRPGAAAITTLQSEPPWAVA